MTNIILFFLITLSILVVIDIYTLSNKKKELYFTKFILSLLNPTNIIKNLSSTIKDYESFNFSTINNISNLNNNTSSKTISNNLIDNFSFVVFTILFIFLIIPFIVYISKNKNHSIPITILIIILLIIGPIFYKYFYNFVLFLFNKPKNYLYKTQKRKKYILTI